jgi:hypothetical protein
MGTTYNPAIVTDGLVLCLDAANQRSYPKSGTTWSDLAGSNDGALVNGPTYTSMEAGGISFDGANDLCNISSNALNPSDGTICIWLKSSVDNKDIYNSHSGSWNQNTLWVQGSVLRFRISDGTKDPGDVTYSGPIFNGIPKFICCQWTNGGERSLWVDSVKVGSLSSTKLFVPSSTWEIGYKSWQVGRFLGNIYSIHSYNRSLTADEVRQNYEATVGRFS